MNEPKACPCCGGKSEVHCGWAFWVECAQCGVQTDGHNTLEGAVETWNRRPTQEHRVVGWVTGPTGEKLDVVQIV